MKVSECIGCIEFPCADVDHDRFIIPEIELEPEKINTIMISEAPPEDPNDYFYAENHPFNKQTTSQAFHDSGMKVSSILDLLQLGVYVRTAVKCGKTGYAISTETIEHCSEILHKEIELFPNARSVLLM